jgi:hypothetical protein
MISPDREHAKADTTLSDDEDDTEICVDETDDAEVYVCALKSFFVYRVINGTYRRLHSENVRMYSMWNFDIHNMFLFCRYDTL